jgi:1,2-diacylglycerol 3-alpha-glucosyltransferase
MPAGRTSDRTKTVIMGHCGPVGGAAGRLPSVRAAREGGRRVPLTAWIFGDLPLRRACGPSYMVESWQRELGRHGVRGRLFTPSGTFGERHRTADSVTFRTLRSIGFRHDYHALYSSPGQLVKARKELPDVVLVTTPGRLGVLGVTLAAKYRIPLVLVVSTDTTGAVQHYSPVRLAVSGGPKPLVLFRHARRARSVLLARRSREVTGGGFWEGIATRYADALRAEAAQLVLLSPKSLPHYADEDGADGAAGAGAGPLVTVLPVGIDRLPRTDKPAELTWREGALRVLYVGRFAPEKSLGVLVRGLRIAVDRGVDAHLALVGEGALKAELEELGRSLGVQDRLTVIGPYPRHELGGVYASADVFAFPSLIETQAFVLNEAAHEGLPLLVSDAEVNPVVSPGWSALVVPQSPLGYADGMQRMQDAGLRARFGNRAQELARGVQESRQSARLAVVLHRAAGVPVPGDLRVATAESLDLTGFGVRLDASDGEQRAALPPH